MKKSLVISGKVQGIGFRYWTKRKFKKLGMEGKVWNNEDGTVGVECEGDENRINELMEYLKQGPPLAKVRKIDILD